MFSGKTKSEDVFIDPKTGEVDMKQTMAMTAYRELCEKVDLPREINLSLKNQIETRNYLIHMSKDRPDEYWERNGNTIHTNYVLFKLGEHDPSEMTELMMYTGIDRSHDVMKDIYILTETQILDLSGPKVKYMPLSVAGETLYFSIDFIFGMCLKEKWFQKA